MTVRYLSLAGVANRIGISPTTAKTYADDGRLPSPDAIVGDGVKPTRGWLPETIDAWNASRPGRGRKAKASGDVALHRQSPDAAVEDATIPTSTTPEVTGLSVDVTREFDFPD